MAYQKHNEELADFSGFVADNSTKEFLDFDPIGLPDEKDVLNIKRMMRNHERVRPGEIAMIIEEARLDRQEDFESRMSFVKKEQPVRRALTLPQALMRTIEEAYPIMFKNRKHLAWFKKNFPQFVTGVTK
jgi:hypothetical protein